MKPNRATIRYTNSQWLREDATESSVGRDAVPKRSVGSGAGGAGYLFSIGMYSLSSVTQR